VDGLDRSLRLICLAGYFANRLSRLLSKNFALSLQLKSVLCPAPSRPDERGVRVVTDVGCGMRWTRRYAKDEACLFADGEAVWS
jgi:hypothetical protein